MFYVVKLTFECKGVVVSLESTCTWNKGNKEIKVTQKRQIFKPRKFRSNSASKNPEGA